MLVVYLLLSIALIIGLINYLRLHPFLALFVVAIFFGFAAGMDYQLILQTINDGFGGTLGKIGLVIIFGVIIGAFLENTGGAYALAEAVIKLVGKKRVPTAMGILGYFVSIPVFADSGFILLSPLNKSLSKKAGISLAGSAIALAMGLTIAHNLVPPTPGPIAAAGILNADLGLVLALAIPISIVALIMALLFATKFAARTYIDPNPDVSQESIDLRMKTAPSAFKASLPIVVPIVLIMINSRLRIIPVEEIASWQSFLMFLGEPVIALVIGMLLAFTLPKKLNKELISTDGWVGKALKDSANILLITGAGGVFGKMLQNSGIAGVMGDALSDLNLSFFLPFLIASAIKLAQGSSTVALITAASIVFPMMGSLGFATEMDKALLVISIGAGSMVVSHANDSFFWVVTQMSGMNIAKGYKLHSLGTLVIGLTSIISVLIISLFVN
ncbi:MAG TPA: gluconate transporter [Muricauda sp.]|uniref:GntP family permease n=1 Tax=Flagellimonas aurea TaxID=2915619 RepID=A0ABS3G6E0_9FLAO|nr:GntP family permease [Allomuricauda aurea]MBC72032.1 gluconate transporter [Allomuricauda sp.]MBO0354473.1 GntP family permease [Allomuricauda aurea]HBU78614.1 gluconate transporter [Allomuricauda sp.]|tara:strand:+ start:7780 stop:9111 length:1332 start_codon:yes stop_codon:yes gene_type:complete